MVGGGKVVSSIFLLTFLMLTTSLITCRRFPSLKLESLQIASYISLLFFERPPKLCRYGSRFCKANISIPPMAYSLNLDLTDDYRKISSRVSASALFKRINKIK